MQGYARMTRTYTFYNNEESVGTLKKIHTFANNDEMIAYLQKNGRRPLRIIKRNGNTFDVVISKKGIMEKWFNAECSL